MIAVESFKRFRIIDMVAILIFGLLWLGLDYSISALGPQYYALAILCLAALMSLVVHLVRKAGAATIFLFLSGIMTYWIDDIGVFGIRKVIVFVIAGIVFELVFLVLKLEVKKVQLDIVISAALASACIPLFTGLILSSGLVFTAPKELLNLVLLSFFSGIVGSVLAFLAWFNLRTTRLFLRFEYRH